jgi:FkbM family methyltransferase
VFAGAHIGSLLVPLALRSGARDIEAFEPSPANHRLLTANLALNGLLQSTTVHPFAVGDSSGRIQFMENRTNTGNSRISSGGELQVEVRTLDSVLPPGRSTDLLVIDTEGFEVHALRGATRTLQTTRFLCIEYAPEQLAEQGSRPEDLMELLSARFPSMYLPARPGTPASFFPSRSYVSYLRALPPRRGLLLNLLFASDAQPDARLLSG